MRTPFFQEPEKEYELIKAIESNEVAGLLSAEEDSFVPRKVVCCV